MRGGSHQSISLALDLWNLLPFRPAVVILDLGANFQRLLGELQEGTPGKGQKGLMEEKGLGEE